MSYPITGSVVRRGVVADLITGPRPSGQIKRDFPRVIDGDQAIRLHLLVIGTARTEEKLREGDALPQRIDDPGTGQAFR